MQGPREAKRIVNRLRSWAAKHGKRNGQLGWIDNIYLERMYENSKKRYRRNALYGERVK